MSQFESIGRVLSDMELPRYREDGYLIIENLLDQRALADLNLEMHKRWLAQNAKPGLTAEQRRKIHDLGSQSALSRKMAADSRILDLNESLFSSGLAVFSIKLISKDPGANDAVCHWHQDEVYWRTIGLRHDGCQCEFHYGTVTR